ncbi:hypothetical protein MNBD_GAMMA16-430 [hydrothermal vent metagenome]|uniref:PpiC domain-containing protein n=1 Tax=hydrothermal vent metagenome TaxID=652676 RepID=A0A3B0YQC8_9ZZZZ
MNFNYAQAMKLISKLVLLFAFFSSVDAAENAVESMVGDVFATVNGEVISTAEFHEFLMTGVRQKFYHGKITAEEQAAFRSEMMQSIVDRVLLLQEARKRGIVVKAISLDNEGAQHVAQLKEDAVLDRFKAIKGEAVRVTTQEVKAYYASNAEKFTRPEQVRVSLILLTVPPYAASETWQNRLVEAETITEKLKRGESFASLAIKHSDHESSKAGGDLGFIHAGMLAADVDQLIKDLSPGENAAPIYLLQGVAVFRLEERVKEKLNSYDVVAPRARDLLLRDRREQAWDKLLVQLRAAADIHVGQ